MKRQSSKRSYRHCYRWGRCWCHQWRDRAVKDHTGTVTDRAVKDHTGTVTDEAAVGVIWSQPDSLQADDARRRAAVFLRLVSQQVLFVAELLATVWVAAFMQRPRHYQVVTDGLLLLLLALPIATDDLSCWLTPVVLCTVQHLSLSTEMRANYSTVCKVLLFVTVHVDMAYRHLFQAADKLYENQLKADSLRANSSVLVSEMHTRTLFTRRRSWSFAEYCKHFVARLNDVRAFGYNSARSERIWMKFGNSESMVWSCPWQILGAISAEAASGGRAEILFFLSIK